MKGRDHCAAPSRRRDPRRFRWLEAARAGISGDAAASAQGTLEPPLEPVICRVFFLVIVPFRDTAAAVR